MSKYIKCDEDFVNRAMNACGPCTTAVIGITELLEQEPAADVDEIKHGYWTTDETDEDLWLGPCCVCSVCGSCPTMEYNYCPYCGSKMDLEEGIDNA